jgi:hypothetical protein
MSVFSLGMIELARKILGLQTFWITIDDSAINQRKKLKQG